MNWAIFPSGNTEAAEACAKAWSDAGWRVAVLVDDASAIPSADLTAWVEEYRGTAASFNDMLTRIFDNWQVVACINDDMFPQACTPLAAEKSMILKFGGTYGVIQPTGCWMDSMNWCAPCPIIGREYVEAHNRKPWHEGYYHLYCDQELKEVAEREGVYRTDDTLAIDHRHRSRGFKDTLPEDKRQRNIERGRADQLLFAERKRLGFPR